MSITSNNTDEKAVEAIFMTNIISGQTKSLENQNLHIGSDVAIFATFLSEAIGSLFYELCLIL